MSMAIEVKLELIIDDYDGNRSDFIIKQSDRYNEDYIRITVDNCEYHINKHQLSVALKLFVEEE